MLSGHPGPRLQGARWQIGALLLDESRRELTRNGTVIPIEPKPLNLLMLLLRHAGELVTKDELIDIIWNGRMVSESVIARSVTKLRHALGDEQQTLIGTVYGYGYRYDGPAELLSEPPAQHPAARGAGQAVPGRVGWRFLRSLDQRASVWLATEPSTGEQRVFKFADDAESMLALKRELTVYRLLQSAPLASGRLARLLDWQLGPDGGFLELKWYPAGNLAQWLQAQGPDGTVALETRLALLAEIADAVDALHRAGVLHKDLKPANVLIDRVDGEPRAQLADLGSSRVIDLQRLSALGLTRLSATQTQATARSSGTALYLAPEVVGGSPASKAADLYALGVMLYQLATGNLRQPLAPGWERQIDDPVLRADIAESADMNPERRLDSAAALAERIRQLPARRAAHAANQALAARNAAMQRQLERAQWVRRWQWSLVAVLMLALLGSGSLGWRASRAERRAQQAAAAARELNRFINDDILAAANPYAAGGGRNVTVGSLLDTAAQRLSTALADQPERHAESSLTVALAYRNLGLEQDAARLIHRAIDADLPRLDPQSATATHLLLRAGWHDVELADYADAEKHFEQLRLASTEWPARRLAAEYGLARIVFERGYYDRAEAAYRALLPAIESLQPADTDLLSDVRWDLAEALFETQDWEGARALLEKVDAHLQLTEPEDGGQRLWLAIAQDYRLLMIGRFSEAEGLANRIHVEASAKLSDHHPIALYSRHLLGWIYLRQDRPEDALPVLTEVLAEYRADYGDRHYLTRREMMRVGEAYTRMGRAAEALPLLDQALALSTEILGADHPHTLDIRRGRANTLAALGRGDEAETELLAVLALSPRRLSARNHRVVTARIDLGRLQLDRGQVQQAAQQLQLARAAAVRNFGEEHVDVRAIDAMLKKRVPARPGAVVHSGLP